IIIYPDIFSHDEIFSNIYKIQEIMDDLCLEIEEKIISKTEGDTDDLLLMGGNASAEGPEGKDMKITEVTDETCFTKEAYKKPKCKNLNYKILIENKRGNLHKMDLAMTS
uniref:Translationally-controlled tumor protein n=1 Tax=Canis lupus dingo TaxID=286419 RepID=A0A8C0K315_CANLU